MAPHAESPPADKTAMDPIASVGTLSLTTTYDDTIRFYLNGTCVAIDDVDPEITLLEYLRGIGLTGTKLFVAAWLLIGP